MASGWNPLISGFALRMSTVRPAGSEGAWKAYRSQRSRRWSPRGGPRLRPVKWLDMSDPPEIADGPDTVAGRAGMIGVPRAAGRKPPAPGEAGRPWPGRGIPVDRAA